MCEFFLLFFFKLFLLCSHLCIVSFSRRGGGAHLALTSPLFQWQLNVLPYKVKVCEAGRKKEVQEEPVTACDSAARCGANEPSWNSCMVTFLWTHTPHHSVWFSFLTTIWSSSVNIRHIFVVLWSLFQSLKVCACILVMIQNAILGATAHSTVKCNSEESH